MRKFITAVILSTLAVAAVAFAADEYQSGKDITTGSSSVCVSGLRPKTQYAVRCTEDAYVRVSASDAFATDGGTGVSATTKDAIAPQNKMFDIPTAAEQTVFCALQKSAAGTCYVYIFRDTRN